MNSQDIVNQQNVYDMAGVPRTELANQGPMLSNTLENAVSMIAASGVELYFDEFLQKEFIKMKGQPAKELSDHDVKELTYHLQKEMNFKKIRKDNVDDAATIIARKNVKNAVIEYMESCKWDGIQRIRGFFPKYLGAPESEYSKAAGENFWISIVARTRLPGAQVDNMVILEGPQGSGKTSCFRTIGGPFYGEISVSPMRTVDFAIALQGKLICDISELSSFGKAAVEAVKAAVSCRVDRLRFPYDKRAQDVARRCILVGTTNHQEFLKDQTGGRRFWPIKCGTIDLELLKADRDQLFAEALAMFKQGRSWHEMPIEETLAEQESRRIPHPWECLIEEWLQSKQFKSGDKVPTQQILTDALCLGRDRRNPADQMKVSLIMHNLGWRKTQFFRDGNRIRGWEKEGDKK